MRWGTLGPRLYHMPRLTCPVAQECSWQRTVHEECERYAAISRDTLGGRATWGPPPHPIPEYDVSQHLLRVRACASCAWGAIRFHLEGAAHASRTHVQQQYGYIALCALAQAWARRPGSQRLRLFSRKRTMRTAPFLPSLGIFSSDGAVFLSCCYRRFALRPMPVACSSGLGLGLLGSRRIGALEVEHQRAPRMRTRAPVVVRPMWAPALWRL